MDLLTKPFSSSAGNQPPELAGRGDLLRQVEILLARIKTGVIYSPAHGDTAFTVPMFDQFMLRTMPDGPRKTVA